MLKLLTLCMGTTLLLYLSQRYNPAHDGTRSNHRHYLAGSMDVFLLAAVIWMTCFSFLRTSYNDTNTYIRGFLSAQSVSQGFVSGAYFDWMENPMSVLYRDWVRSWTGNYHVYFFFPALLLSLATVQLFRHYSVSPVMSLFLYFCLGTYVLYLAAFKQGIAMAILLLALPYAERKEYVTYSLLVMLATLFHFYAIIYLLVPLLFGKPWGKTTWIMLAIALFTLMTYDWTLGELMRYMDELGGDIKAEELFDGHSVNGLRVMVYWVPGLMALMFRRHVVYQSTPMENLVVNLSILCACVLTIGLAEGANLYGRMAAYFEWAIALTIPLIIKKIFTKSSAALVSAAAAGLFFGYFYYEFAISKDFGSNYQAITMWQFVLELLGI